MPPTPRRRADRSAADTRGDRLRGLLRSPSRLAAVVIAAVLALDLPGTIGAMGAATQAELAVLVVVAPVVFGFGLYFIYRLWRRPTRTVIAVFLVVWVTPAVATIVGGGLRPGAFIPLALDVAAAILAAFALTEPRTLSASGLAR